MLLFISSTLKKYIVFESGFILRHNQQTGHYWSYIFQKTEEQHIAGFLAGSFAAVGNRDARQLLAEDDSVITGTGGKDFIALKLLEGDVLIGWLVLLFAENRPVLPETSRLLQEISCSVSMTTANIIAREEIGRREQETSLLLSLSNDLAAVKNRQELVKVVNGQIKQLFPVEELGFFTIEEGGEAYRFFVIAICEKITDHPDLKKTLAEKFDVHDPLFNEIMQSKGPVVYDVAALAARSGMPYYVTFWRDTGIGQMVISALRAGGTDIGAVLFIVKKGAAFDLAGTLLQGVCSQLALAVSNIVANETVRERELEKAKLLEFSNAVASVRDKEVLGKILRVHLKELFDIDDYVIHALSKDKKTHRPVLFDPAADFAAHPDFAKLIDTDTGVQDGIFNTILEADDIVIFDVTKWFTSPAPPTYSRAAESVGLRTMAGVAIRLGRENIAVMNFRWNDNLAFSIPRPLFKGICSQIAITLSNLMANEEVNRQLTEIGRYREQLEEEKIYLKEELSTTQNWSEIIGGSGAIQQVFRLVSQVGPTDSTVLLLGETGTGKELIARAIHAASPRKNKLMVKINCAALPAGLIESELFGHERGSFTGAVERRIGKFELADKGTLFLDEIGEMPVELQVKLLRALQEKEIERLGGKATIKVNVRVIAATNRNLEKMMAEGKFRADLYYRLNIFPIHLPPLRERKEDIAALALHFVKRFSRKSGKPITSLSGKVLAEMKKYSWPGNIRELEHVVERSVLLTLGQTIKDIHLSSPANVADPPVEADFKIQSIFDNEKEYILKVLQRVNGRIAGEGGAADLLGIPPSTLSSRMKKLGIRRQFQG
ncbi:sigma-54 interaction domain-containing protein [Dawidia soli]|nr:sigma 54-interacting transcriptional regulator [Dawidia soli]